ncbi:hypothetical protein [Streptomyces pinistramenti]|uniref:hypothetical protein n=1 Tax=Streptomyces pinistramenti TaxID=2884812 RepID=UPI001D078DF3|nr:hypothetical protein [Streptomyces pinistramenti]MCB5906774.1 hypothetical protein [Streptomyces pinistramenti]
MSFSGDLSGDPNRPYPQPQPYGQVPAPQNPVPAQQNPYAQQPPPPAPGGYGYPSAGPQPPGGGGRGASGWPWAIGGAVAASAIWASVMFATGSFGSSEPRPDLAGYSYTSDLCADTSLTPFESARYRTKDSSSSAPNPQHSGARQPAIDSMWCNISLEKEGESSSDYASNFLYNSVTLHKKADPAPEFADGYRAYEKQDTSVDYTVEPVTGIGDEAYLVMRKDSGNNSGSYVILGVRDGWLTYQSTWSSYASGRGSGTQPRADEIADMLKSSARETLGKLRG